MLHASIVLQQNNFKAMENINYPVGRRLTTEQKQDLITKWRNSGQSKKAFCLENNLKYHTFVTWESRSKKGETKKSKLAQQGKSFAQLKIGSSVSPFAELNFKGGNSIRIFHSVPADFIRSLIY